MGSTHGNISTSDVTSDEIKKYVQETQDKINDFKKCIHNNCESDKSIIFISNTGAGKSTLINYLAGRKLVFYKESDQHKNQESGSTEDGKEGTDKDDKECTDEDDEYCIDCINPIPGIKIGNSRSSETKIPASWLSEDKIVYWDCPGFGDTSGVVQEITNAFYINELLNHSKKSSVVLLLENDIVKDKRSYRLSNLVNEVEKLGLIDSLQSVSLVLTSCEMKKVETLTKIFETKFLPSALKDENHNLEKFLNHFIEHRTQIALFPKPTKIGEIDTTTADEIREVIERVAYVSKDKIKPSIPLTAISLINSCVKILNNEISCLIADNASKSITAIHDLVKNENEYSVLKNKLKTVHDTCDAMRKEIGKSQLIKTLTQFQKVLNIKNQNEIDIFETNISLIEFFSLTYSDFGLSKGIFDELDKPENLCKTILSSSKQPEIQNKVLTIQRPIMAMSEIKNEFLLKKEDDFNSINVHSYSFYFDSDATLPGKNLCIQTQHAYICNDIKVDLKGENAEIKNNQKAQDGIEDGSNGKNGIPGYPGKPGGSFYLFSKQCTTTGNLIIDVSGGKGGKGQDGGNGRKGKDGEKSSIENIFRREEKYCVERKHFTFSEKSAEGKVMHFFKTLGTFNGQMLETYRCDGLPGQTGGNAGKGGKGGIGGCSGTVTIDCPGIKFQDIKANGENGPDGSHGNSGEGGLQGKSCSGKYISEYVLPGLRVKEKELNKDSLVNAAGTTTLNVATGGVVSIIGQAAAQEGAKTLAEEGAKTLVKEGIKTMVEEGAKTAVKEGMKTLVEEGAKTAVKEGMKTLTEEGMKTAVEEWLKTTLTNSAKATVTEGAKVTATGFKVAKFGVGMTIGLAVQTICSIGSAYASSGWIDGPNEESKRKVAEKGTDATVHNTDNIIYPENNIVYEPDLNEFQEFKTTFENKMNLFMEKNEVELWFK